MLALIVLGDALTAPTRAPARRPDKWGAKLALLLEYRAREGDCNVPKRHEERGVKLGTWVVDQRCAARRGALSDERRRRLVEHGFEFEPGESAWERQPKTERALWWGRNARKKVRNKDCPQCGRTQTQTNQPFVRKCEMGRE